ncbi:MAG: hypothetical protein AAFO17_11765 [Pseudomonadota bacterium]
MRTRRRIHRSKGFAMIDALVALAVATLTLSVLTSATWGLKLASDRRASLEDTGSADWLQARRTLTTWASDVSNEGAEAGGASLIGTATTLRMIVRDRLAQRPYVGEFRIERAQENGYALIAARHDGLRDARVTADAPRASTLLRAPDPVRFVYLFETNNGTQNVWRYETGDGSSLPIAIAIEQGNTRQVTVRLHPTLSQTCFAALGPGALESKQCAVR